MCVWHVSVCGVLLVCSIVCYVLCRSSFRGVNPSVRLHLYVVKPSLLDKVQHDIVHDIVKLVDVESLMYKVMIVINYFTKMNS